MQRRRPPRCRPHLPHRLGEPIGGDDLAAVEEQHRQQTSLELTARCHVGAVSIGHPEWPEHLEGQVRVHVDPLQEV